MFLKAAAFALAIALLPGCAAQAQTTPPAPAVDARGIDAASWLAGRWVGEGLGGQIEETWASPAAGQMVGHFRLMRGETLVFYELMLLDVTESGGIRMRVKHFNPDFVGWEEKDGFHTFEPVSHSAGELRFNGLVLRRVSETEAEFVVTLRYADGVRDEVLRVRRAPL